MGRPGQRGGSIPRVETMPVYHFAQERLSSPPPDGVIELRSGLEIPVYYVGEHRAKLYLEKEAFFLYMRGLCGPHLEESG